MKLYPSISEPLADWAQRQPVFFTGSAPTHGAHINVSPKGLSDSHFAILGPNECAYIDRTGSGCETIAHSYENGRLCLMFMSFGSTPRILRLFCRSNVVEWDDPIFPDLVRRIAKGKREAFDGARAVILCHVFEVQTSCGFGVPRVKKGIYAPGTEDAKPVEELLRDGSDGDDLDELSVFEERPTLDGYWKNRIENNTVQEYQKEKNLASLDGLPGLMSARRAAGEKDWTTNLSRNARKVWSQHWALAVGFVIPVLLYVIFGVCECGERVTKICVDEANV